MKPRPIALSLGLAMLAIVLLSAVSAPFLARHDPLEQPYRSLAMQSPTATHPLGIDAVGRDVLTRMLYGSRVTLGIALGATALAVVGGTLLGLAAGACPGWFDSVVRQAVDFLLAFPPILVGLVALTLLEPSPFSIAVAVGMAGLPPVIRQVRAAFLAEQAREYVLAAQATGASRGRIALREILPNCLSLIAVLTTLSLASAVMEAAGLSFLGLSGQPDVPEWGSMLRDYWRSFRVAPWLCVAPGLAIAWTVLAFHLVGDGLRRG